MAAMSTADTPAPITLEKAQRVALVVWSSITATVLLLAMAGVTLSDSSAVIPSTPERDAFLKLFPVLAAVNLVGSAVIYQFIRRRGSSQPRYTAHAHAESAKAKRYMGFFGAMVVSCALHEAVAVIGFVLTLITKDVSDLATYVAIALIANVVVFPSKRRVEAF